MAREYLKMGHYFSIGGALTFKNADRLRSVISQIPIERMLVETDCPYLAPVPHRGKRNNRRTSLWLYGSSRSSIM